MGERAQIGGGEKAQEQPKRPKWGMQVRSPGHSRQDFRVSNGGGMVGDHMEAFTPQ